MSFSSLAKEELLRLPLGKNCCVMSELSALVQTSGCLQLRGGGRVRVTFRVESAGLARRIFRLLGAGLELTPRLHFVQHARLGGRRSCVLTLEDEAAQKLLLSLTDDETVKTFNQVIFSNDPDQERQCRLNVRLKIYNEK